MINGIKILKEMYPDMNEKNYQPSGLDLNLGKVYLIDDSLPCGIIDGEKILPVHKEIAPQYFAEYGYKNAWKIEYGEAYIFEVDRQIQIGDENAQFYLPRSTLLRCGVDVCTALGDTGYNGKLSFLVINNRKSPFYITKGERFAQLVDFQVTGVDTLYDGDYQEKKE